MNLQEAINKRHSVREYERKIIPKKILIELIKDASKAPSAKNEQNYKFYIVNSKKKRDIVAKYLKSTLKLMNKQINKLEENLKKVLINFYSDLGGAQTIIFVYRKKIKNSPEYQFPNDLAGISCAIENLMLSAVSRGLGTCWIGSFKEPKIEKDLNKLMNVKEDEELITSILVGYPKKGYKPLIRKKKKLKEIIKFI